MVLPLYSTGSITKKPAGFPRKWVFFISWEFCGQEKEVVFENLILTEKKNRK